jgi:hypothetical protein
MEKFIGRPPNTFAPAAMRNVNGSGAIFQYSRNDSRPPWTLYQRMPIGGDSGEAR